MHRQILHLDLNSYFASVEQAMNPSLRGKPIAVIGASHRTVITTSSYEARAFGVKTGMSVYEARSFCRDLILVVGNNRRYTHTSSEIMKMMGEYTDLVEPFSIDEAFMDVTGSCKLYGAAENIAMLLKARIKHRFNLTCSIGIAPNKLLAKLASDLIKPDGLVIVHPNDVSTLLERTPISDLCGIGKKMGRHLKLLGINTCGELGRFPVDILRKKFGIIGDRLIQMGRGIDDSPVVPMAESDPVKSVGHSSTLDRDIDKREDVLKNLLKLSEMVGRRARRYQVAGKTIHLYVRYADFFSSFGKQMTLSGYVNQSDEIYRAAVQLFDSAEHAQPVRMLGVRLTNLQHNGEQLPLFQEDRKKLFLTNAMDEVNDRFGEFAVTFASLMAKGKDGKERKLEGSTVISPAWRPEGIRKVDVK
ncbi:MAG: DNA polymerase IV [Geobacteraceae bacterium]